MELFVIVAVVIGVAWFAVPRLTSRRHTEETLAEAELRAGGMMSWLPAWMLFGAMSGGGHSGDAGSSGPDAGAGWGGDSGGGDLGSGGGDMGGGGFGGD